jgi:hypothetical protein
MSSNPPSEWSYWVDYDPDISAALQRLREDVFARGDYATGDSPIAVGSRLIIPHVQEKRKPSTIEELLEQEGESGTHSILDITSISPKSRSRAISPFPDSLLVEYFDSQTPSPSEVQEVYELARLRSSSPKDGAAFTLSVISRVSRRIYSLPDLLEIDHGRNEARQPTPED